MHIVCCDLEGVFVPEIWINVAEKTGIADLRLTTRDISDYDVLMQKRIEILRDHNLKLKDIVEVIQTMQPLEGAYEHEVKVTGLINDLVNLAIEEKDHATNNFLQWFVKEQVEEEATASEQVQKIKLAGEEGNGLFMLDRECAQRMPLFTFPQASKD